MSGLKSEFYNVPDSRVLLKDNSNASYLACFDQVVTLKDNESFERLSSVNDFFEFVKSHRKFMLDLSGHIEVDYIEDFLSKDPLLSYNERHDFYNETLKRVSNISEFVDLSDPFYSDFSDERFNLRLSIIPYHQGNTSLCIELMEPFYIYSVDVDLYPDYLISWIYDYLMFLADIMGFFTVYGGLLEEHLTSELCYMGLESGYELDSVSYQLLKFWIGKDFVPRKEHCEILSKLEREASFGFESGKLDNDSFLCIVENLILLYEVKQKRYELKSLDTLIDEFYVLWRNQEKSDDFNYSAMLYFERQLIDIKKFGDPKFSTDDIYDCGNSPFYYSVLVDFNHNIFNDYFDIGFVSEQQSWCWDEPMLAVDLSSETALKSLHRYILVEYFLYKLCKPYQF